MCHLPHDLVILGLVKTEFQSHVSDKTRNPYQSVLVLVQSVHAYSLSSFKTICTNNPFSVMTTTSRCTRWACHLHVLPTFILKELANHYMNSQHTNIYVCFCHMIPIDGIVKLLTQQYVVSLLYLSCSCLGPFSSPWAFCVLTDTVGKQIYYWIPALPSNVPHMSSRCRKGWSKLLSCLLVVPLIWSM